MMKEKIDKFFKENFKQMLKTIYYHKRLCNLYNIEPEELIAEAYLFMLEYPFFIEKICMRNFEIIIFSNEFTNYIYLKYVKEDKKIKYIIHKYNNIYSKYFNLQPNEIDYIYQKEICKNKIKRKDIEYNLRKKKNEKDL